MAGINLSSGTLSLVLKPSRALPQLSRTRQSFCPGYSRASCYWSRNRGYRHPQLQLCLKDRQRHQQVILFSSAGVNRAQHEDATEQDAKTPRKHANQQTSKSFQQPSPPTTPTTKLATKATNLASKLKIPPHSHENIYTIPNILTFSRLIATPLLGYLIIHNHHLYAFTLFAYAGISDLLDGWIARRYSLQTVVGSVVDPMADKALMTTLVTCLAINGSLPLPLAALILGRDASLAVAAIYYRYASLPAPKTLRRYWDFSLPSAEVHPTTLSKGNTFLQLVLVGTTLCVNLLHDPSATESVAGGFLMAAQEALGGAEGVKTLVQGMSSVVAATTVYSGLEYVWKTDAVKILGDDEVLKKKQGFRGRMIIGGGFGCVIAGAVWLWLRERQREQEAKKEDKEE